MIILATQQFNEGLKNAAIYICFGILLLLAITIVVIVLLGRKKSSNKINYGEASNILYESLGGKDNIESYQLNGSRFSLNIKNVDLINKDKLSEIGIENSIIMSNKITLVLNEKGKKFVDEFIKNNSI